MKTGILFDLDGTLLDTLDDLTDSVNHILAGYGCPERSRREIRSFLGNGARELIRLSLPRDTKIDIDEALAAYQAYYRAHSGIRTRPFDGIPEALAALAAQYPIAIVSNKPDAPTKSLCAHFFGAEICAIGQSDDCPRKPAPEMLYRAMSQIGVDACIYVGDSEVDILTAKNVGAPCVSVLWGFRDEADLINSGATHLCRTPAELPEQIKELTRLGK